MKNGEITMGDDAQSDVWLTSAQAAAMVGVTPGAFRTFVASGRAPKPDDPDSETPQNRRRTRWRKSTVEAWLNSPQERAVKRRNRTGRQRSEAE